MRLQFRVPSLSLSLLSLLAAGGCARSDDDSTPTDDDSASGIPADDDSATGDPADDDSAPGIPDDVVVISDGGWSERLAVLRADTGEVIVEVDLDQVDPGRCAVDPPDATTICITWEVTHRVGSDGDDRLAVVYQATDYLDDGHQRHDPVIGSVLLSQPPVLEWAVERLDFSGLDGDPSPIPCHFDAADPCEPAPDAPGENRAACRLNSPHGVYLLSEDDESARALVTDTFGNRVVEVTIDKGSDCATVDAVYASANVAPWGILVGPNDVFGYEHDGDLHVLVTFRNSSPGTAEQGGFDHGRLLHAVRRANGSIEGVWAFPPVDEHEPSFTNSVHNVDLLTAGDGTRYVVLAHSNGLGDDWYLEGDENDAQGSVTLLTCCDEPPRYLFDAHLPGPEPTLGYLRDVDLIADGVVLVTDSGCVADTDTCTRTPWVGEITLPGFEQIAATDWPVVAGTWSADHASQTLVEVTVSDHVLGAPILDVLQGVYEADLVRGEDLGQLLGTR